jgi:membrane-associated phospholipid phosphatase
MDRASSEFSQSILELQPNPRRPSVKCALAWALSLSTYFFGIYFLCNWIVSKRTSVPSLYFGWELRLPFVPAMIVPYLSEDLFFFFAPFLCMTHAELRRHGLRLVLAVNVAAVIFLLWPLRIGFSRTPVAGFDGLLFSLLNALDRPYNLAPSLHLALLVLLWAVYRRHVRGLLRRAVQLWFVLIGVSTVLTRQHHLIDVLTGLALGAVCLYLVPDGQSSPAGLEMQPSEEAL